MEKQWELEQQRVDTVTTIANQSYHALETRLEQLQYQAYDALKQTGQLQIKDGNDEALIESSFEQKRHDDELAIYAQELAMGQKRLQLLAQMKTNPYFARIDYCADGQDEDTVYFGITSLNDDEEWLVYDWRSPIADLFYNGGLGEQTYIVEDTTHQATVNLRRQFLIQNGRIVIMEDTDEALMDNVLLQVLDQQSTAHMKQIVGTIQREQNALIRMDIDANICIEGVAGSGKTAVLLQRIAYLLYRQHQTLTIDDCLMLSPNRVYNQYVAQVLPSLGETDIARYTLPQFLAMYTPATIVATDSRHISIAQWQQTEEAVDRFMAYVQQLDAQQLCFLPVYIEPHCVLMTEAQLRRWFAQTNAELTVTERLQMLQTHMKRQLQAVKVRYMNSDTIEEQLAIMGDDIYDAIHQEDATLSAEEMEQRMKERVAEQYIESAMQQIEQWQWIDVTAQYEHYLMQEPHISEAYLLDCKQQIQQQCWYLEDSKYMMMLVTLLTGQSYFPMYRYIFIDEVQDYTALDMRLLYTLYPHAKYNICGDYHQLLAHHHGHIQFDKGLDRPFVYQQLTTSYRSTAAITAFASQLLPEDIDVQAIRQDGQLPTIDDRPLAQILDEVKDTQTGRIALITLTETQAKEVYERYHYDYDMVYVDDNHPMPDEASCLVLPLRVAKGLEFDTVIALYTDALMPGNVLYTLATRAMHSLIFSVDKTPNWLEVIDKQYYQQRMKK